MSWPQTGSAVNALAMQAIVPSSGDVVTMTSDNTDGMLSLVPASTLATLTITLPSDASSKLLQIRRIFSSRAITSLTINGATTIYNNVGSMNAGDCVSFIKVSQNTWARNI